jgi:hypothetical protein
MAKSNKSKWVIGLTGAALSAFVITQVSGTGGQDQVTNTKETITSVSMSKQEKELVQLDWNLFPSFHLHYLLFGLYSDGSLGYSSLAT